MEDSPHLCISESLNMDMEVEEEDGNGVFQGETNRGPNRIKSICPDHPKHLVSTVRETMTCFPVSTVKNNLKANKACAHSCFSNQLSACI